MQESKTRITQLIIFCLQKRTLTEQEQAELNEYIEISPDNKLLFQRLMNPETLKTAIQNMLTIELIPIIKSTSKKYNDRPVLTHFDRYKKYYLAGIAATVLLIIGAWWMTRDQLPVKENDATAIARTDTTNLADQSYIELANKHRVYLYTLTAAATMLEDSSVVSIKDSTIQCILPSGNKLSNKAVAYHTIYIKQQHNYKLQLTDSSVVELNAMSAVRYPVSGDSIIRSVTLSGQAYFNVKEASGKSFTVNLSPNMEDTTMPPVITAEVYGTQFDIKAYKNDSSITIVQITDKLKVKTPVASAILRAGDLAKIGPRKTILISRPTDIKKAIAWKDKLFRFDEDDIITIVHELERNYDVSIKVTRFSADVPTPVLYARRDLPLEKIIKILEGYGFRFQVSHLAKNNTIDHP